VLLQARTLVRGTLAIGGPQRQSNIDRALAARQSFKLQEASVRRCYMVACHYQEFMYVGAGTPLNDFCFKQGLCCGQPVRAWVAPQIG
jgi:hypothetical protein